MKNSLEDEKLIKTESSHFKDFIDFSLLFFIINLIYSSAYVNTFFFADDTWHFPDGLPNSKEIGINWYLTHGRPFIGYLLILINFLFKIFPSMNFLHFLCVLFVVGFAFFLYKVIKQFASRLEAFLVALGFAMLPSMQIHVVYVTVLPFFVGYGLAALASWLLISEKKRKYLLSFLLLSFSFHIYQATPFFCLVTYFLFFVSNNSFYKYQSKKDLIWNTLIPILTILAVAFVWSLVYKVLISYSGHGTYRGAAVPLSILDGNKEVIFSLINSAKKLVYVFEIWSYPIPIKNLGTSKFWICAVAGFLFFVWYFFSMLICLFRGKKQEPFLMGVLFVYFIVSLIPIAADNFSGRQHLFVIPQTLILIMIWYSWKNFSTTWNKTLQVALIVVFISWSLGVSSGVYRGLVMPNAMWYQFTALMISRSTKPNDKIHVALISSKQEKGGCYWEPCSSFFGRRMDSWWHMTRPGFYRTVSSNIGRNMVNLTAYNNKAQINKKKNAVIINLKKITRLYRELRL